MKTHCPQPSAAAERTYLAGLAFFALIAAGFLGFALFGFFTAFQSLIAWLLARG